MERIRTLTGTLVATLLYFTSIGVEAKVLSCEATEGNGRSWIPREFRIDLANDRKTAQVISPITEVFGAKPFEKSFLGSSLWSRGKGKSKMGDYYNYQLRLDLDSNDTEAKIVMIEQGYYDIEVRFRCNSYEASNRVASQSQHRSEPPAVADLADLADSAICARAVTHYGYDKKIWEITPKWRPFVQEAKRRGLDCGVGDATQSVAQIDTRDTESNAVSYSDKVLCMRAAINGKWETNPLYRADVQEAKRRGLDCGVGDATQSVAQIDTRDTESNAVSYSDKVLCMRAAINGKWETNPLYRADVQEAKRRGLDCGVGSNTQIAKLPDVSPEKKEELDQRNVGMEVLSPIPRTDELCPLATRKVAGEVVWRTDPQSEKFVDEVKKRRWFAVCNLAVFQWPDNTLCNVAIQTWDKGWSVDPRFRGHVEEAAKRNLTCGLSVSNPYKNAVAKSIIKQQQEPTHSISGTQSVNSEEVQALRDRLAKLEAEKIAAQQSISQDTQSPSIRITASNSDGARGTISGVATDNTGIAEVLVDGQAVPVDSSGRFSTSTFIPSSGVDVQITAYDLKGLSTTETIRLERTQRTQQVSRLAAVNPLVGPKQKPSRDRAALIIGVEDYARAPSADYASGDATMFADYAREKLGISDNNVKVLSDTGASKAEILRALKVWLPKAVKPDTTDLYVFYAGHGMPTADGTSAYLVPYDGDIQLLEDTAISRKRFFDEISATKPRSATFFFDNCYSGATRSEQQLLAARPLTIKVEETEVPENYLVFAAGETDQIAGVEPEVKHGRFSYFVFKGLEGEADANSDGKISAGELHTFVRESVGRFSAGAQTPTMLGDGNRWVLR